MLVVDGSFEEQVDELATFMDTLSDGELKLQEKVENLSEKDEIVTTIVNASDVLVKASERGMATFASPANDRI